MRSSSPRTDKQCYSMSGGSHGRHDYLHACRRGQWGRVVVEGRGQRQCRPSQHLEKVLNAVANFTIFNPRSLGVRQWVVGGHSTSRLEQRGHQVTVFKAPLTPHVDLIRAWVELRTGPVRGGRSAPKKKLGRNEIKVVGRPKRIARSTMRRSVRSPSTSCTTRGI